MKKYFFILAAFLFIACNDGNSENKSLKAEDLIKLRSWDNQEIVLKRVENGFVIDGSDKIVLIDIFGTFCPPCQKEAPMLFDLQKDNLEKLQIIGLSYFEEVDDEKLKEFAKKYNAYYFITYDAKAELIVDAILSDIKYNAQIQLPFKVILENGVYKKIENDLFILGGLGTNKLEQIKKIIKEK